MFASLAVWLLVVVLLALAALLGVAVWSAGHSTSK
jgi:hypothetical protein